MQVEPTVRCSKLRQDVAQAAGTAGHPAAWLQIANDELVLRDPEGVALWTLSLAPPLFTKVAPSQGASGLGPAPTLQWTPVPNDGYWVCWDTIDNGTCDTMWWPSPVPTQAVSGLSAATYYWPFDLMEPWALRATPSDVSMAPESRGGK